MDGTRVCGVPDTFGAGGSICKWGKKNITWTIQSFPDGSGLTHDQIKAAFTQAWANWAAVCDINPQYVDGASDVVVTAGAIDGPSGVLAWSEMPCNATDTMLTQKFDSAERWVISVNPAGNVIDLVRVACHEIGHVIGIPHISTGNLLAPYYSTTVGTPQTGDIQEAQTRYGAPIPVAVTPVTPTTPTTTTTTPSSGIDLSPIWTTVLNSILAWLKGKIGV